MSGLILNSFPVEVSPPRLTFHFLELDTWEESTIEKESSYPSYTTFRYEKASSQGDDSSRRRVRLVLLSGPAVPAGVEAEEFDVGALPGLGRIIIENSLARHLAAQGMTVRRGHFEHHALRRVDEAAGHLVHVYAGISFRARRPFRESPHSFTLSAQWIASAVFSETLASPALRSIAGGLGVLYTPRGRPEEDLRPFVNQFVGHVRQAAYRDQAEVMCRDHVRRSIPLVDLTLEASPEAIRRYEQATGSSQQPSRIWRRLQQLSKVLTKEGRRNTFVLRDRLEAIRGVLGGFAKEQLVLPLATYAEGTVSIGLAPVKVEITP